MKNTDRTKLMKAIYEFQRRWESTVVGSLIQPNKPALILLLRMAIPDPDDIELLLHILKINNTRKNQRITKQK